MIASPRRLVNRHAVVCVWIALLCAGTGCSARTAFVHPGLAPVAPGTAAYRLVLIGDAGEMREPEPVLEAARLMARERSGRTTVLYLGDNAYPSGFSGSPAAIARAAGLVRRQIEAVSADADVLFLPGNHDWARHTRDGLPALQRQALFARAEGARFLPATPGCPGPDVDDLPRDRPVVRVVALDTQWWLHNYERGDACTHETREEFVAALRAALQTSLPVVIAGHHPLATHGKHGGFADWKAHLFPLHELPNMHWAWLPLPGLGSLYPIGRKLRRHEQDLGGRRNSDMRAAIGEAVAGASRPPLIIYAAGHDHSQQVLTGPGVDLTLVTGGGVSHHHTAVGRKSDTLYAHEAAGFMMLDVAADAVSLAIVDPAVPSTAQRWFRLERGAGGLAGRTPPSRAGG